MIFVVNDLTWFEQKYLAMLHQNYVQCKKNKEPAHSETSAHFRLAVKPIRIRNTTKHIPMIPNVILYAKDVNDVCGFTFFPIESTDGCL